VNRNEAIGPDQLRQGTPAKPAEFTRKELAAARRLVRRYPRIKTSNRLITAAALELGYALEPCDGRLSNAWIEIGDRTWALPPGHIEAVGLRALATLGNA
jgi:hypothetical protein